MFWNKKPKIVAGTLFIEKEKCPNCGKPQYVWHTKEIITCVECEAMYKAKDVPDPKYLVKCGDCGAKTLVQASYGTVICSSCGKTVQYKTATEEDVINNLAIFLSQRR